MLLLVLVHSRIADSLRLLFRLAALALALFDVLGHTVFFFREPNLCDPAFEPPLLMLYDRQFLLSVTKVSGWVLGRVAGPPQNPLPQIVITLIYFLPAFAMPL